MPWSRRNDVATPAFDEPALRAGHGGKLVRWISNAGLYRYQV
jgi:hypothetical protein